MLLLLPAAQGASAPQRASTVLSDQRDATVPSDQRGAKPVFWLHFPKCGSSFKKSAKLYPQDPTHAANPCKKVCGGTHIYLPKDASPTTLSNVAAMFREPKQRVASAHAFAKTMGPHWCRPEGNWTESATKKPSGGHWGWPGSWACNKTMSNLDLGPGLTFGNYTACQTHMVMGYGCLSKHYSHRGEHWNEHKLPAVADAAISRMNQFRFVGLEHEWLLSICLFNYLQTGERYVTSGQLTNNRPTFKPADKHDSSSSFTTYNTSGIREDPLDDALYEAAERRFKSDLQRHGITESACACEGRHCPAQKHARTESLSRRVRQGGLPADLGEPMDGEDAWLTRQRAEELGIRLGAVP